MSKGSEKKLQPEQSDLSKVVSWVHIGDLHMSTREQQNFEDLNRIVADVNRLFSGTLNFVYLPGDQAEHGLPEEYVLVREALERLHVPWFSIVGDHDVHTRSVGPYQDALKQDSYYSFDVGDYRFVALNAFARPSPDSFSLGEEQIAFLEDKLREAAGMRRRAVMLMHCYPSDLKEGYREVRELIARYQPLVVDMGHTHYNEVARDAWSIYTTTRSTGQIEEGPVGYSITNLDQGSVSWKFRQLGDPEPFVMITHPSDWRLKPVREENANAWPLVRVRVWSTSPVKQVRAFTDGNHEVHMTHVQGSNLWLSHLPRNEVNAIEVIAESEDGTTGRDTIRLRPDANHTREVKERDQDNAIGAWVERGIPGTQLGPNKNGRKW